MWIKSLFLIIILAASVVGSSMAFFSDTEVSSNNTILAGSIDLLVNGQNDPSGIVDLDDLKPGDIRTVDKTLDVSTNPASVYMHILDLVSAQGTQTEPEDDEEADLWSGDKHDLENYISYALTVNGTPVIATESAVLLPEASSCYIPLGVVNPGETTTMQQIFSFPAEVTNWAQGDTLTFTEDFFAQQTRHNPIDPVTGTGRLWNSEIQKCESCTFSTPQWLSESVSATFGLRKNGSSVLAARKIPNNALNANNGPAEGTFVALGYGGTMVYKFPTVVGSGVGNDMNFYEITNGRNTYPLESAEVHVSQDGSTWLPVGPGYVVSSEPGGDGVVGVDVNSSGLVEFQYIRVKDTSNATANPNADSDGYDLDAVRALYGKSCTSDLN